MKTTVNTSYIILGSALLLASCAQEDNPVVHTDSSDRRIVFHTSLPGLTTKATEIVTDLPHFYMTAFDESDKKLVENGKLKEYFANVYIEKNSGSDKFVSNRCIWPDPGQESDLLHFFAYYPELKDASLVNATSVSGNDKTIAYKIEGFKVAPNIADQVDLVTAYATGSMADNLFSGINLNFRHQLSRIEVKAHGKHKSCDIEIAGVRIANVAMQGNFTFQTSNPDGAWTDVTKGNAEYIFCEGDTIVSVGSDTVSIMGRKIKGVYDNCAMLIPASYNGWDHSGDIQNNKEGLYLNVLLRIIDKTPTTGKGSPVQYPYFDTSQGLNAMNIPREYFAVEKTTGKISKRVYRSGNGYSSNEALTVPYTLAAGEEIREFGWAALPISGDWQPGYSYTYTLDYTTGVGLHGPDVTGDVSPKAGDPVISDKVGISVEVNIWLGLNNSTTKQIEVPGS